VTPVIFGGAQQRRSVTSADASPRRRRWDLVAFAAVLLGPLVLVGGALAARQDTSGLEDELLRHAAAIIAAGHPRPVHVPSPEPGSFGEALAFHLPPLEALSREIGPERESLRAVAAATEDEATLSAPLRSAIARADRALHGLLAGTRRARADLVPARDPWIPADGATWSGLELAAELAGVRIRRTLDRGRPGSAAATCLDALALGRDAAVAGGLIGRMTGAAVTSRLVAPCASALSAVRVADARALLAPLRSVRDAVPSQAEMLRAELVLSSLFVYAPLLDAEARARVGPRGTAIIREGDRPTRRWERAVLRDSWHAMRRAQQRLVEAAMTAAPERDAAIARAEEGAAHWINPIVHLRPSYLRYVRRAEAAARQLDALVFVLAARTFRAARGEWPDGARALREAGLVTAEELERSGSARFDPGPRGELRIRVPLPQGDPARDPPEAEVTAKARTW
jgi:hypothetical protein